MLPDIERYRHHLDGMELAEDQKAELIRSLWSLLESFVDQSFGVDVTASNFDADIEPTVALDSSVKHTRSRFPVSETNH